MDYCQVSRDEAAHAKQMGDEQAREDFLESVGTRAQEATIKEITDEAAKGNTKPLSNALEDYFISYEEMTGWGRITELLAPLLAKYAKAIKSGTVGEFPSEVGSIFALVTEHAASEQYDRAVWAVEKAMEEGEAL